MSIKIGICGLTGKMGQAVMKEIKNFDSRCIAVCDLDLESICKNSDVVIDFSHPSTLKNLLLFSVKHNTKLVIGTTGFDDNQYLALRKASCNIPIVYSANMSIGVNLLQLLVTKTAQMLDETYDIEIIERHHRDKLDAPSGTAKMLSYAVTQARGLDYRKSVVMDRCTKGKRNKNDIGIASIRSGNICGQHDVIFAGNQEVLTLKHEALDRSVFAHGAIFAALWVFNKNQGLYSMQDVLA